MSDPQTTLKEEAKSRIEEITTHAQIPFSLRYYADLIQRLLNEIEGLEDALLAESDNNAVLAND